MINQNSLSLLNWTLEYYMYLTRRNGKRIFQGQTKKKAKAPPVWKYWHMEPVIWSHSFAGILFSNLGLISVAESLEMVERYTSPHLPYEIVK